MKKTAKQFKIRCYRPSINALKQQKSRRKKGNGRDRGEMKKVMVWAVVGLHVIHQQLRMHKVEG
jgi:hypothetical protein